MRCRSLSLVLVAAFCACTDASGEPPSAAVSGEPAGLPLPARTWRLSHAQYAEAVRSFLGVLPDTTYFEAELDNGLFPNMSGSGLVRAGLASDYYDAAALISAELAPERIAAMIAGRAPSASEKLPFIRAAVSGAFRRPATAQELDAYAEIFDLGGDDNGDVTAPFRAVIRALLTSPFFLYRTEIGTDPTAPSFQLTPYELASLLSFSLLNGPPPATLLAAAESGELNDPSRVATHVQALLALPEAATQLQAFMMQWLELHHFSELEKDPNLFPDFATQRPAMWLEAARLLAEQGSLVGSLRGLMTAETAPSTELAAYYASLPSAAGSTGVRAGVLGLGAVIAAHSRPYVSSPTLRGLFVRERFLCQQVSLPPSDVPSIFDSLLRSQPRTTRELYEQHSDNPACAGCHALLDSIGFNFEDIDAAGRYRSSENTVPIDTSGELTNADVSGPTRDRGELIARLADSASVRECVARQAYRFYLGALEAERGEPVIAAARNALEHETFGALVSALMTSHSARERVRP